MALIKSISGIRGTIGGKSGDNLTPIDIVKYTAAFGTWVKSNSQNHRMVIGRDARLSGKMISGLVNSTLMGMGIDVVDLGLSTTPTVEMAVPREKAGGGIIITASHNPEQWNALKLLNERGEFISSETGQEVLGIAEGQNLSFADVTGLGSYKFVEGYFNVHIDLILQLPVVDREAIAGSNLRIAVDAVNSSGGIAVPQLLQSLGVETIFEFNCEATGRFAHNPEPLPENIAEFCRFVKEKGADAGIVVDPDVDRLALVCEDGTPFGEEYTLVAVADYILQNEKGATVSNLSSTRALRDVTEKHGASYHVAAVGEVNVVNKMKSVEAVIGGEGNGGVIYPELHYGRDALAGIALFLTHLAKSKKTMSALRANYPDYHISKQKMDLPKNINVDQVLRLISNNYPPENINDEDGLKIDFHEKKEWVHLRKSNTEPIIRIYAESASKEKAELLAEEMKKRIQQTLQANA